MEVSTCAYFHAFTFFSNAGSLVVYGEPEIVELTGILNLQTFADPPKYESIKDGDAIERYFFL